MLQHVQQRQPVACAAHAGLRPKLMRSMPMRPHRWAGQPAARLQCLVLAQAAELRQLAGLVASL